MPGNLDSFEIPVRCQECGHEFTKTVAWLKENPQFPCPGCGKVRFEAAELLGTLQQSDAQVDSLMEQIKRLFKF